MYLCGYKTKLDTSSDFVWYPHFYTSSDSARVQPDIAPLIMAIYYVLPQVSEQISLEDGTKAHRLVSVRSWNGDYD